MNNNIKPILLKGKSENASNADWQEMLALFHMPDKEFELKENLLAELNDEKLPAVLPSGMSHLFDRIWTKIQEKQQKRKTRFIVSFAGIAAALFIGLVTGVLFNYFYSHQNGPGYYVAHSPKGSVSDVLLPDGTVIYLNAGSRIQYAVEGKKVRQVILDGEAWFDVAENRKKPFIVHTGFYNIKVTGTQFNVKAYPEDEEIVTTLEKGTIVAQSSENLKLATEIMLKPGEQLVFNKNTKTAALKKVNTKWYTSWKDNKLIFINMELKDLIVLLERKYGVNIEVKSKDILNLHFDGTIKNESIIEILDIIQKTLPIRYAIVGQHIEITNNKN